MTASWAGAARGTTVARAARAGTAATRTEPTTTPRARSTRRPPSGPASSWPATCAARGSSSCSPSSRTSSWSSTATGCSATTRRSSPASPGSTAGGGRHRPAEGHRHGGERPAQLRHAPPRGVPQGDAGHGARGTLRPPGRHLRGRPGGPPRPRVRGARHRGGDRAVGRPDDPAPHADRDGDHRRGRLRRRAGDRGGRRGARPRERGLLGDHARGLREHPVAHDRRGARRRRSR